MYVMGKPEAEAVRKVIESGNLFRYRGGPGRHQTAALREPTSPAGSASDMLSPPPAAPPR